MSESPLLDSVQFLPNGETSLCLVFTESHMGIIHALSELIQNELPQVEEIIPAYESITLVFEEGFIDFAGTTKKLRELLSRELLTTTIKGNRHLIQVCYDAELAPDLTTYCQQVGLTTTELIAQHTAIEYPVAMLGFQPGFIYLDDLPEHLALPRKTTPVLNLAPGSVAIGGSQTGIYSLSSPGGWWVIGLSPATLFQAENNPPNLINPGDIVQFEAISLARFRSLTDAN